MAGRRLTTIRAVPGGRAIRGAAHAMPTERAVDSKGLQRSIVRHAYHKALGQGQLSHLFVIISSHTSTGSSSCDASSPRFRRLPASGDNTVPSRHRGSNTPAETSVRRLIGSRGQSMGHRKFRRVARGRKAPGTWSIRSKTECRTPAVRRRRAGRGCRGRSAWPACSAAWRSSARPWDSREAAASGRGIPPASCHKRFSDAASAF